jgi:hypothetical protein
MSKKAPSLSDKQLKALKSDMDQTLNQIAQFMNDKYEAVSGQIYFKLDLIAQEQAELKAVFIKLAQELEKGLSAIRDELLELNNNKDFKPPVETA